VFTLAFEHDCPVIFCTGQRMFILCDRSLAGFFGVTAPALQFVHSTDKLLQPPLFIFFLGGGRCAASFFNLVLCYLASFDTYYA
jgi:hypothetical protein